MGEMLALFAIVVIGLAAIEAFFWRFDHKVRRALGASSVERQPTQPQEPKR